jgi:general secretion pathway protein C
MSRIVSIAAILLLGVAAADLASAVLSWRLGRDRTLQAPVATGDPEMPSARAASLGERNVFGAILSESVAAATSQAPALPPGQFMALGVMEAGPLSSAIIRDVAADSTRVFRLGARIFASGDYLAGVDRHGAILAGAYGRRRLALGVPPDQQPALIEAPLPPGGINISRAEINASVRSPEQLLGESQISPEIRDGKIIGFRISAVADNTIVKKMDIRAGDIIRSVNGHQLDSLERSTQIWEQVKKATEVHMTIERGGVSENKSYYLRP